MDTSLELVTTRRYLEVGLAQLNWGLFVMFTLLSFGLIDVLRFLLYDADLLISDNHKSFLCGIFGLAAVAIPCAGTWYSSLLITSNGASIEKLITYVMDGNNTTETEEESSQEHHMWLIIRSPDNKVGLDDPLLILAGNTRKLAVNYGKKIVVCCALTVVQIFVYLMSYLVGEELIKGLGIMLGIFVFSGCSVFLASFFKLFSASHRYTLTIAKLILAQSCVCGVVIVTFGPSRDLPIWIYFMIMVNVANILIYAMRNPVEKLYTFNSPVTKKPSCCTIV